jgi:hypothetical protein
MIKYNNYFVCIDMVEGRPCKERHSDISCGDSEACVVWCRYAGAVSGGYCNFKDRGGTCVCLDCI